MGFFRTSPIKKLQKAYEQKMAEAMVLQRRGDIQGLAVVTEEAQSLLKEIEQLKQAD